MVPRIKKLYKNLIIDGEKESISVVQLPEFMHVSVFYKLKFVTMDLKLLRKRAINIPHQE